MVSLETIALLAVALAAGGFVAHWVRLPPAFGYLVTGILFGVFLPGHAPHGIEHVAEIGILVLLFLIGIELDLQRLRKALRATAFTLPFDILLPVIAVTAIARMLGWSFVEAAALGLTMAVSSTLFGERITAQPGYPGSARQRVLGVLISEDVAAGALIALLVVLASGATDFGTPAFEIAKTIFILLLLTGIGIMVIPKVLDEVARRHTPELLILWAIGIIALFGYIGTLAGSAELGALVAGVAAAEAGSRYVTRNSLIGLRDVAAAMFFFAAGVVIEPQAVLLAAPFAAAIAVAFVVAKQLVHVPSAIAGRLHLGPALQTGAGLATIGEFNLILASVAEREGLAHPSLRAIIVAAMIIMLPMAAILQRSSPAIERWFWRRPKRLREPLEVLANAVRRRPVSKATTKTWQDPARRFLANLLILGAVAAASFWLQPLFPAVPGPDWLRAAIWLGITFAVASPLLFGTYRAYRRLVWTMVGLQPGERVGAGKVRMRFVDALVASGVVLVLAAISLWIPRTIPVLLGGASIAIILGVIAWRRLSAFHGALEAALGRVLGHDAEGVRFLDHVLEQYPWGVRFAAVSIPARSPLQGTTLKDSRLGQLTGATVAAIQRGKTETVNPPPETRLRAGDHLVLLGDANQLSRAEALIVSHGDAVRLSAQSLAAEVEEVVVTEESPWVGKNLGELGIRESTGTLIVGRWQEGANHPQQFSPGTQVCAGDRLILLGTPLQLQRAKTLAAGIPVAEG